MSIKRVNPRMYNLYMITYCLLKIGLCSACHGLLRRSRRAYPVGAFFPTFAKGGKRGLCKVINYIYPSRGPQVGYNGFV